MQLVNLEFWSVQEGRVKPQFPSSSFKILKPSCLLVKFSPDLSFWPYIKSKFLVAFGWVDFPLEIPQTLLVHLASKMSQPVHPISESSQVQIVRIQIWQFVGFKFIVLANYPSLPRPFGVSKPMNEPQENWFEVKEHCSYHLSLALVGLVHGVSQRSNP